MPEGTDTLTVIQITTEVTSDAVVPIAVIFFDGHSWTLKTVQPPSTEMMADLKRGLQALAEQFSKEGF